MDTVYDIRIRSLRTVDSYTYVRGGYEFNSRNDIGSGRIRYSDHCYYVECRAAWLLWFKLSAPWQAGTLQSRISWFYCICLRGGDQVFGAVDTIAAPSGDKLPTYNWSRQIRYIGLMPISEG